MLTNPVYAGAHVYGNTRKLRNSGVETLAKQKKR